MINRVSELPLWGPEEQIRKFINQHDQPDETGSLPGGQTQLAIRQERIENLDEIFQKQLIWSYDLPSMDDAYFYWDWCPMGSGSNEDPKWQISKWYEYQANLSRNSVGRTFKWDEINGYTNKNPDELMPSEYDAQTDDVHAKEDETGDSGETNLSKNVLRHNIMRSWIEVSEWLGDAAVQYGSHNGYVSRKMTLRWLFNAIRALINWKMNHQDGFAEVDIRPLEGKERFLSANEKSTQDITYDDEASLDQRSGCCADQSKVRARRPDVNGVLKVRGNEHHYGERAWFYTHNSFIGECRFYHNARFLGQTTFDKEINGTAMRARWSGDLAEMYESDSIYEPGTLVMFGGEKEITCSDGKVCNAIVTEKPGVILNGQEQPGKNMVGIALTGMVPVLVVEQIKKFDKLIPSRKFPGYARRRRWYDWFKKPIGIALEDSHDGRVKCVTRLNF